MHLNILGEINNPQDVKSLSKEELEILCEEIREEIITVVSKNGGHLASNLGAVELTVALHKVFDMPKDQVVFDVGHQCYTHKILTGRRDKIHTIRTKNGLSGFPKRKESEYDSFDVGHSSTSISAALGIATSKKLRNEEGHTVALIGDGALSGGLAYEGLNNAGRFQGNFIVILNDNKMSICPNVGSMARYLSGVRMNPGYLRVKKRVEWLLNSTPLCGEPIRSAIWKSKSTFKNMLYQSTIFEDMGFNYYGPVDGHDLEALTKALNFAKKINRPILIHVNTVKGKGYHFAEQNPKIFHGTPSFDIKTGDPVKSSADFSTACGETLCSMAELDNKICAITAAMRMGTGLYDFSKRFPERFFDVGIAEGHAVTFASGLAADGMLPVFAVYSSFLQRSYDQIIHDAAIQKLNVTLAVDRAGIVGEDGETHQGVFDAVFLNSIPNVTIFSPSFFDELKLMLGQAVYEHEGVKAVRYPRGGDPEKPDDFEITGKKFDIYGDKDADVLIVTYGRIFSEACKAREQLLKLGKKVCILKLNIIKPIDKKAINFALGFKNIFFFEEGMLSGGIGETFGYQLGLKDYKDKYRITAIKDKFVPQSKVQSALRSLGLDAKGIEKVIMSDS